MRANLADVIHGSTYVRTGWIVKANSEYETRMRFSQPESIDNNTYFAGYVRTKLITAEYCDKYLIGLGLRGTSLAGRPVVILTSV